MLSSPDTILEVKAPAKVNLLLSVHGPREDGFHELSSLIVALDFGDHLTVKVNQKGVDQLSCDDMAVPLGPDNLILKAAEAFRATTGGSDYFDFDLIKRVPMGAGLGGGSSDAVAALKALNALTGSILSGDALRELSSTLGSDCPFFVDKVPAIMRGRGERLEPLPDAVAQRLKGQKLVLFRPEFPIGTAWAYGALRAGAPASYEPASETASRLSDFINGGKLSQLLFNSFEAAVGQKYLAIPALLEKLRSKDIPCLMSGSGSCCFALISSDASEVDRLKSFLHQAWGEAVFWVETSIC